MSEKILVGILGYGCHITDEVKAYLDMAIAYITANQDSIDAIILTGGYTNRRSAPGTSEASVMAHYLRSQRITLPLILEETATTTLENMEGIQRVIKDEDAQLIIFCDSNRRIKVRAMAHLVLKRPVIIKHYPIFPGRREKFKQLLIATPAEVLCIFLPFLKKFLTKTREDLMDRS